MTGGQVTDMSMSGSRAVCLLPFAYFAATRLPRVRDLAYLVATSWVPAIWLLWRLTDLGPGRSILAFAAGYLAFIAVYEIGYLINDAWDARRTSDGRKRVDFELTWPLICAFIMIRFAVWLAIGFWTRWLYDPVWLLGSAVLAIAIAQHNLVQSKGLRLASFYELAVLRFIVPILGSLPNVSVPAAILTALLLYAFPRFLAYMDSKDLLVLKQRTEPSFVFLLLLSLSPLIFFLAFVLSLQVLAELAVYFLAIHGLWWAIARSRERVAAR